MSRAPVAGLVDVGGVDRDVLGRAGEEVAQVDLVDPTAHLGVDAVRVLEAPVFVAGEHGALVGVASCGDAETRGTVPSPPRSSPS